MRFLKLASVAFLVQANLLLDVVQARDALQGINATAWYTWPRFNSFDKPGIFWPPFPPDRRMPDSDDFILLKSLGFSTVRIGVDPALFMGLEGIRKEKIKSQVLKTVEQALDVGLVVIFDLHPNSRHKIYGQTVYAQRNAQSLSDYVEMTGEVAETLAVFPKGRVLLELMNEPRMKCSGDDLMAWQAMLDAMINKSTDKAPHLPLVVSGACTSSIEGLLALEPSRWKRKDILFTFHFYEPFPFTHQSAPFIPWPEKHLSSLPWPPRTDVNEVVVRVADLPVAQQENATRKARAVLAKYASSGFTADVIRQRLVRVAEWADRNGVERELIFMGEFGVYRGFDNLPGATCEDRAAWVADVVSISTELRFSWSYFHYDGPFGIIDRNSGQPDEAVLKALGLRPDGECREK